MLIVYRLVYGKTRRGPNAATFGDSPLLRPTRFDPDIHAQHTCFARFVSDSRVSR